MGASFTVPTLEEMHQLLISDYACRFPNADVSKLSDNWKRLRTTAMAMTSAHAHIDTAYEDLLPDGAGEARLPRLGDVYKVTRKPATPAKRSNALRCVGSTIGATVTIGDQLAHQDGTLYQINETVTVGVGYADVDVLAISTGSITRKQKGEILKFVSAPSGIETNAELQLDMNEDGDDLEAIGAYRVRILDHIAQPGRGGNASDYQFWALEVVGIDSAYVYPLRDGFGTVDLAALHTGRGSNRILTADERTELKAAIDAKRPVSVAGFRVLSVVTVPIDAEILVFPEDDAEFVFDWDDTVPLSVSAYTAGTRTLKFTTSRPTDMRVGDRLIYKRTAATKNDGAEVTIEALGVASDEVVLTTDPTNPPQAGNAVYSGGPLIAPLRGAVLAHYDSLGPAHGSSSVGLWEDTLRTSTLFKIVQTARGVLDSTIVTPAVNVVPNDPTPQTTVELIIPRQVLVRRAH